VLAAEVTTASPDFGHLDPMVATVEAELEAAGVANTPAVVVADAGYWHQKQMENIVSRGTEVLTPRTQANARAPARAGTAASMRSCDASLTLKPEARSTANAKA